MKRVSRFIEGSGTVACVLPSGDRVDIPVAVGILKHPTEESLRGLLEKPAAARKYTKEALKRAPWSLIREFPLSWLKECMQDADLKPGRRKALEFMLGSSRNAS